MAFTFKNYEELWEDFKGYLSEHGLPLTSLIPGERFYTLSRAVVALHANGWSILKSVTESFYVATATGEFLDRKVADFGMARHPGALAEGTALAIPLVPGYSDVIPAGTIFETLDRGNSYELQADVTIASGVEALMSLTAREVGEDRNLVPGTVLVDSNGIWSRRVNFRVGSYLDDTDLPTGTGITGGADSEDDDALRARFIDYLKSMGRGTLLAIRTGIKAHPQVKGVVLQDFVPGPGFVTAWVHGTSIPLPTTTKDEILAELKNWRAGGVRVKLADIYTETFVLDARVTPLAAPLGEMQGDYSELVRATVEDALTAYVNDLSLGQSVHRAGLLQAAMAVEGVASIDLVSPSTDLLIVPANQYKTIKQAASISVLLTEEVAATAPSNYDDFVAPEELDC